MCTWHTRHMTRVWWLVTWRMSAMTLSSASYTHSCRPMSLPHTHTTIHLPHISISIDLDTYVCRHLLISSDTHLLRHTSLATDISCDRHLLRQTSLATDISCDRHLKRQTSVDLKRCLLETWVDISWHLLLSRDVYWCFKRCLLMSVSI